MLVASIAMLSKLPAPRGGLVGPEKGPALSLVVWALKREVRAIRGCLGMHRR